MRQRVSNVRVVAGKFKGLKIPFRASKYIRPTTNKTKETIFNWLMGNVQGSVCLDMFAGTGSLGLEALSRGASYVYFAEKNRRLSEELYKTTIKLKVKRNCEIMTIDSLRFPFEKKIKKNLDIIFIDPPFRKDYLERAFNLILDKDFIDDKTLISCEIEKEKEIESILLHWNLIKSKVSGQSRYCLFKRK